MERRLFFGLDLIAPWPPQLPNGRAILEEFRHLTLAFLGVVKYEKRAPKFCLWFEEHGPEGMTFYSRSRAHWKKVRTVNVVERLNEEVKRRTRVARLFPNEASRERLVIAVVAEIHDEWITGKKYLSHEGEAV